MGQDLFCNGSALVRLFVTVTKDQTKQSKRRKYLFWKFRYGLLATLLWARAERELQGVGTCGRRAHSPDGGQGAEKEEETKDQL
jgi:hypothetical protein